jgi:hypothetical protein
MIARTRRRPRVRSCSFRTLGWLIRREAALRILRPGSAHHVHTAERALFCRLDYRRVAALATRALRDQPHRKDYP